MLRILRIFLTALLIANLFISNCYADDVKFLNKDDKSPYSGFLFPTDQAQNYRKLMLEVPILQDENTILKTEKKELSDRNDQLAKAVNSEKGLSDVEKIVWGLGGVFVTSFLVYGFSQLKK